jgi:hypothetical protein
MHVDFVSFRYERVTNALRKARRTLYPSYPQLVVSTSETAIRRVAFENSISRPPSELWHMILGFLKNEC